MGSPSIHRIPEFRIGGTLLDEIWPAHDLFEEKKRAGLWGDGDREIKRASGAPRRTPYAGISLIQRRTPYAGFPSSPPARLSRWADLRCTFPSLHSLPSFPECRPKSKWARLRIHRIPEFRIRCTLLDEIWPAHIFLREKKRADSGATGPRNKTSLRGTEAQRRTLGFPSSEAHAVRWIPLIPSSTVVAVGRPAVHVPFASFASVVP